MGSDIDFKLVIKGESKEAADAADEATKRLNRLKEATKQLSAERQKIAKTERRDRFNALSEEEKLVRLRDRQLTLERQLARARSSGKEFRSAALATSLARTRFDIGRITQQQKQNGGTGSTLERLNSFTSGGIGAFGPAGIAVGGIAATVSGMAYAMKKGFQNAMQFSDEIGDYADLLGTSRMEVVRLLKAAGAAGVRSQTVMSGLSAVAAARGGAIAGDDSMIQAFQRYGVSKQMLEGSDSNLKIAQAIVKSLGSGGMLATDRLPLGSIFGRRPEQTFAALQAMQSGGNEILLEKSLQKMDEVNQKYDELTNKLKLSAVIISAILAKAAEFAAPHVRNFVLNNPIGATLFTAGSLAHNAMFPQAPTPSPSWAEKRRSEDSLPDRTAPTTALTNAKAPVKLEVPTSEAMARIGLYRGGIDPARTDILRAQLETLRAIKYEQVQTVSAIKGEWR